MGYVRSNEEREGYEAAKMKNFNCPYPANSRAARDWHKGQEDYDTDRADYRSSKREGW